MKLPQFARRTSFVAAMLIAAGQASAIGVGDIERQSSLGQPLDVLIPLNLSDADELNGAIARIAGDDLYERSGLFRAPLLERASAHIVKYRGQTYVQVQSAEAVREPVLCLMIEVVGLNGMTLRRAYDLLLDPPAAAQPAVTVAQSAAAASPQPAAVSTMAPPALPAPQPVGKLTAVAPRPPRHRTHASHKAQPLPAPSDSAAIPTLYPPLLRLSERLEHPPILAAAAAPAAAARPAQPADAAGKPAVTATLVGAGTPLPASGSAFSGWLLAVFGLLAALTYVFWSRRKPAQTEAQVRVAQMLAELRQQPAAEKPESADTAPAAEASAKPAAYVLPPREIQAQAEAPLELHPSQALDFYQDVAQLLLGELEKDPKRLDLRHKLIEVYFAADSKEAFREQTRFYLEQLQGRPDEYWSEIVRMGRQLLPDSNLYSEVPQLLSRTVVQTLPVSPVKAQAFQRFYEAVNQARLSARQAELETAWGTHAHDSAFQKTFAELLRETVKRPTKLLRAERLGAEFGAAQLYRKYEDQRSHDDVPLINALGQVLLAKRMGKKRVVAATIEGGHGVAVADAAHKLGLECTIYMKESDQGRHADRARRIRDLGAGLIAVQPSFVASSDDVRIHALDDWMQDGDTTLYINSIDAGPYPYPSIVLNFQSQVGREAWAQLQETIGHLPEAIVAGTGDGFSAIGLMQAFLSEKSISLYCVETTAAAAGRGKARHGFGREHSWLRVSGRVGYVAIPQSEAQQAMADAEKFEGWQLHLAAGEVLAQARRVARQLDSAKAVLVMLPKPEEAEVAANVLRVAR